MKERIDILLVERRLVESRTKAQWLIKNGFVFVRGNKILKPGKKIDNTLVIQLKKKFPYVGRGGLKLEAALRDFSITVKGRTCADVGASIGGFTDCLLKHGAMKIYAVDKATNLLHPSLICEKNKNIILPILGVDACDLLNLREKVDICTIDVTYTSLKEILPNIKKILRVEGSIIALVKPIFETAYWEKNKLGVIQESQQLAQILTSLIQWCQNHQLFTYGIIKSPLRGKEGAIEFFLHLKLRKSNIEYNFEDLIQNALRLK
ncbi:MAG: TlyA family RNA methyltransferase [Promethearchaeota archaeon]|jgi:23S rRNA (cytidine1920-2'-O)/16S rRNA (cytidine1409-2'-O)-methyltransferase